MTRQNKDLRIWQTAKADEYTDLLHTLKEFGDPTYLAFNRRVTPGLGQTFGVRMPVLRRILHVLKRNPRAKELWDELCQGENFEERMLAGMVLPDLDPEFEPTYDRVLHFLPQINNWALCDTAAGSLKKWAICHEQKLWEVLPSLIRSDQLWNRRFGVVLMLHFLTPEYLKEAEKLIAFLEDEREYYVLMGIAWVMSYYFFVAPEAVMDWLRDFPNDEAVNLTIRKIGESHRGSDEIRKGVKNYKR